MSIINTNTYKSTNIPWLGDIPADWEVVKWKFLYESSMGATILGQDLIENGTIPVYSATETDKIFGYVNSTRVELTFEDFVIPARGNSIGNLMEVVEKKATCTQTTIYAKRFGKIAVNTKFIFYYCKGLQDNLFEYDVTAIPQITVRQVKENPVVIPPLATQQAIANYLDTKCELIAKYIADKCQIIELLQEQKKSLIYNAVTKGLDPKSKLKPSGVEWLGDIPADWKMVKLKYLTNKIVDGTHFTPTYLDSGIPFLRVTDIQSKNIDLNNVKYISSQEHTELTKRCNPQKGDILLSKNGTIGITKIIDWDWEFSIFVSLCLIKCKNEILDPNYFTKYFSSEACEEQIKDSTKTTSVSNLHLEMINEIYIILPPLPTQTSIVEYLDNKTAKINQTISAIEQELELIEEYKKSLIYQAVTGKNKID